MTIPIDQTAEIIKNHLQPLIGLQLTIARRAADMRNFHFGPITKVERGSTGAFALHIQCSWRIEGPQGIVTGRSDLWEPEQVTPDFDWDAWNWNYELGNYQDKQMRALLGNWDAETGSFYNQTDLLFVEAVSADAYGGAVLSLSGGYRLVIFPNGAADSEDWRLFRPTIEKSGAGPHFVVSGGKIESVI